VIAGLYGLNIHDGAGHASAKYYEAVLGPTAWRRSFKFAFIRHPWDRLYSAFEFAKRGGFGSAPEDAANRTLCGSRDFVEFVEMLAQRPSLLHQGSVIFRPQHIFVNDRSGKCILDKLYDFSDFQGSIRDLTQRLQVAATIPMLNARPNRDPLPELDEIRHRTEHIVRELYSDDYKLYTMASHHPECDCPQNHEPSADRDLI
jgi:hypothetical protein